MPLTNQDLKGIREIVVKEVEPIKRDTRDIKHDLRLLTTTVDGVVKIVRRHDEEWLVLRAQHEKIRDILVKKGIATEDELAIA
ncbi:MAG: hypothetical protein HYY50_03990 [Candidatus Kerfeldbacteria bacterium]|nr:hypothetical protein [Candidatus Kerfeldbacteria bacterium]